MPQSVASYQVSAFVVPANLTTADADQVRGNDNTLRSSFNGHDSDGGVHFQGSALSARPVAGQAGRKWMTTDDRRIFYDDGANWLEIAYAPTASPTFTGLVTAATLNCSSFDVSGSAFVHASLTVTATTLLGNVTISTGQINCSVAGAFNIRATDVNGTIDFSSGNAVRWRMAASGAFLALTDGVYDIGLSAGNRPRTIYLNGSTVALNVSGTKVVGVQQTGWTTDPTGTLTRTTFDSTTVTLANLAARVAALIVDLRVHGLIGP